MQIDVYTAELEPVCSYESDFVPRVGDELVVDLERPCGRWVVLKVVWPITYVLGYPMVAACQVCVERVGS